jgi:hypothetical protein
MLKYFSAGFFGCPVYDQTQGSGAVFFLTLWITLMLQSTKEKWGVFYGGGRSVDDGWFIQSARIKNEIPQANNQQGVCHTVALPFTLKSILRKKKNYGNSKISPCKNIIFKKSSKRKQNPSRYHNSITNLKFQHNPKYHLSKILICK